MAGLPQTPDCLDRRGRLLSVPADETATEAVAREDIDEERKSAAAGTSCPTCRPIAWGGSTTFPHMSKDRPWAGNSRLPIPAT